MTSLRNRLTAAWRYSLWSLVLVRLLLPLAAGRVEPLQSDARPWSRARDHSAIFAAEALIGSSNSTPSRPTAVFEDGAGRLASVATPSADPSTTSPREGRSVESIPWWIGCVAVVIWALGMLVMSIDLGRRC